MGNSSCHMPVGACTAAVVTKVIHAVNVNIFCGRIIFSLRCIAVYNLLYSQDSLVPYLGVEFELREYLENKTTNI